MKYQIAEKFKSVQGEGLYTGCPMAFIRFVGCSVGKKICQHCDTVFEQMLPWQGGGEFTAEELITWAEDYDHVCLTGGEPLDQDLTALYKASSTHRMFHIETSGTKVVPNQPASTFGFPLRWICVSPKPGFLEEVVMAADEVKVIVPGLGEITPTLVSHFRINQGQIPGNQIAITDYSSPTILQRKTNEALERLRWPTLQDALRWADAGKLVYIQPRNGKLDVDHHNLMIVQDIIRDHPNLRLSTQMHKILRVQ